MPKVTELYYSYFLIINDTLSGEYCWDSSNTITVCWHFIFTFGVYFIFKFELLFKVKLFQVDVPRCHFAGNTVYKQCTLK